MGKFDRARRLESARQFAGTRLKDGARDIKFEVCCKSGRKKPGICMHIMVEGGRFDQPSRNKGEIRADP